MQKIRNAKSVSAMAKSDSRLVFGNATEVVFGLSLLLKPNQPDAICCSKLNRQEKKMICNETNYI